MSSGAGFLTFSIRRLGAAARSGSISGCSAAGNIMTPPPLLLEIAFFSVLHRRYLFSRGHRWPIPQSNYIPYSIYTRDLEPSLIRSALIFVPHSTALLSSIHAVTRTFVAFHTRASTQILRSCDSACIIQSLLHADPSSLIELEMQGFRKKLRQFHGQGISL